MSEDRSAFYPPRARWYSPVFRLAYLLKRATGLDRIRPPRGLTAGQAWLSLLVPGFAWFATGFRTVGKSLLIAYGLAAGVFIVALGYWPANLAFGLMVALHASGVARLFLRWLEVEGFRERIGVAVVSLAGVGLLFYAPALRVLNARVLMPLRVDEQVLVVRRAVEPGKVRRGEWLAYELAAQRHFGGIIVHGGYAIGPALGVAGDVVRFTPLACEVNGQAFPRQAFMPTSGELVVPEKNWFIWPRLAINNRNVSSAQITEAIRNLALVQESQFVGRPFRHWFGRRQMIP